MKSVVKTHIGAYGIIIHDEKIALIKKARGGYKGKLDLPGGGIEHTETPEETLKRELWEEAEVKIKDYELLTVSSVNINWEMDPGLWEDLHHIGILYTVKVEELNLKTDADGLDSNGAAWYEISHLTESELSPFTIIALKKLGYFLK